MFEQVHEPVHVLAGFRHRPNRIQVLPYVMDWRGKRYRLDIMGLHHPARRGAQNFHIFEFSSGNNKFTLELNPETLGWTLTEVYHEYSA